MMYERFLFLRKREKYERPEFFCLFVRCFLLCVTMSTLIFDDFFFECLVNKEQW